MKIYFHYCHSVCTIRSGRSKIASLLPLSPSNTVSSSNWMSPDVEWVELKIEIVIELLVEMLVELLVIELLVVELLVVEFVVELVLLT
jgi:hypothetical protein